MNYGSVEFIDKIKELQADVYDNAEKHGWWDKERPVPEMIALLHSEVSEAFEAYCDNKFVTTLSPSGKPEGFYSEIADVVIRALDMAGGAQSNLNFDTAPIHSYAISDESNSLNKLHKSISDMLENLRLKDHTADMYDNDLSKIISICFSFDDPEYPFLMNEIEKKHAYNKTRPFRHGKTF